MRPYRKLHPGERPKMPSVSEIVVVAPNDFARAEFPKLVFWNGLVDDPENVVVDINGSDRSPAGGAFIEKSHVNGRCLFRHHDPSLRQAGHSRPKHGDVGKVDTAAKGPRLSAERAGVLVDTRSRRPETSGWSYHRAVRPPPTRKHRVGPTTSEQPNLKMIGFLSAIGETRPWAGQDPP